MSDWPYLEKYRCTSAGPRVPEQYVSDSSYGFNGMFRIPKGSDMIRCIASDGRDIPEDPRWAWQHVSVSLEFDTRVPRWEIMCFVKDLFWEPEDVVVQYHPAKSEYVNFHPGVLHLWRPTKEKLPTPLAIMVGPRNKPTP
jgi:hypothetical protein